MSNYWCPYYNMGIKCIIGTHATFIPPEDHRDERRAVLDSQAAEIMWMADFPKDDIDRKNSSGLEFECRLYTPTLTRLYRLKEMCLTNIMVLR